MNTMLKPFFFLAAGLLLTFAAGRSLAAENVVPGDQAFRQVHVLTKGIQWRSNLDEARAAARAENKLIFWVHMLGSIDGKTWSAGNSLRAVSLSQEPVYSKLRNRFICGYRNIANEKYAGDSGSHSARGNAVDTTNGAGPHNLQIFVMAADGTVLHCLPGFWNPNDLACELDLAERMNRIWSDHTLTPAQKATMFASEQKRHVHVHSADMVSRSQLQGFDKIHEVERARNSDAIADASLIDPDDPHKLNDGAFRTTDAMLHLRMSRLPFVNYKDFNVAAYTDYGTHFYDKQEDNLDETGRVIEPHKQMTTFRSDHGKACRSGSCSSQ